MSPPDPAPPHGWANRLAGATAASSPGIAGELVLFGAWGLLVPYLGRPMGLGVNTRAGVEIIDHVVPGIVVLVAAAAAIVRGRRPLAASLAALAAGVWMTATHVPLLRQAADGQETWSAALWHSTPGIVILCIGALATLVDALEPAGLRDAVAAGAEAATLRGETPPPAPDAGSSAPHSEAAEERGRNTDDAA